MKLFGISGWVVCGPLLAALGGCGGGDDGSGAGAPPACSQRFVRSVEDVSFGPGQDVGRNRMPDVVYGPPLGGGELMGSLDVVSLGNGGSVTVAFGDTAVVDQPGQDFIVFENAFYPNGDPQNPFAELATVEVSEDGKIFVAFPCTASAPPYGSCAGWRPVFANADQNDIDPTDPALAGGDAFDLADIGVEQARYIRITDRPDIEGFNGVFDLDAVALIHAGCQ